MKAFLLRMLERVANAFREADYAAGREEYMRHYGLSYSLEQIKAKQDAEDRARAILPVGHEDAMSLEIGITYHSGGFDSRLWGCRVYDNGKEIYIVLGESRVSTEARARQLVSALDGARRL